LFTNVEVIRYLASAAASSTVAGIYVMLNACGFMAISHCDIRTGDRIMQGEAMHCIRLDMELVVVYYMAAHA
jgi:hypothetical protein